MYLNDQQPVISSDDVVPADPLFIDSLQGEAKTAEIAADALLDSLIADLQQDLDDSITKLSTDLDSIIGRIDGEAYLLEKDAAKLTDPTISRLQGRNCALPQNRHRKDGCNGLMNRREKQMRQCLGLEPMEGIEWTPNAAGQDSASPTAPLRSLGVIATAVIFTGNS